MTVEKRKTELALYVAPRAALTFIEDSQLWRKSSFKARMRFEQLMFGWAIAVIVSGHQRYSGYNRGLIGSVLSRIMSRPVTVQ